MCMKNLLFLISLFSLFSLPAIFAQKATLSLRQSTSYNTTHVTVETLFGSGGSTFLPHNSFVGGRIGVNFNQPLFKKFSVDAESGYALGGYRYKLSNNAESYHQVYLTIAPQYELFPQFNIGLGLVGDYKFKTGVSGFNFGYSANISKSFGKFGVGFRFINFFNDHFNEKVIKYIPRLYELNLTYRLKTY
jgi:hypothetical protein